MHIRLSIPTNFVNTFLLTITLKKGFKRLYTCRILYKIVAIVNKYSESYEIQETNIVCVKYMYSIIIKSVSLLKYTFQQSGILAEPFAAYIYSYVLSWSIRYSLM